MRIILICLINILFSNELSNWINSNQDIINSRLYKFSFYQKVISNIAGSYHYNLDTTSNIIIFREEVRHDFFDRVIIANKDSVKILNKNNNQLFIDYPNENYNLLLEVSLFEFLDFFEFTKDKNLNYYYGEFNDNTNIKIYFENKDISLIEIFNNNLNIEIFNIKLSRIDSLEIKNYFNLGNNSLSVFDLRNK